MATISVNGVELYFETTGSGDCLVLTHGSWTDGTGWDRVVPGLADRYQVVVWDRRGHSRSQAGDRPGSRAEDAADLAALIEHVGGGAPGARSRATPTARSSHCRCSPSAPTWSPPPPSTNRRCGDSSRARAIRLSSTRCRASTPTSRSCGTSSVQVPTATPPSTSSSTSRWARARGSSSRDPFRAVLEANAPTFLDELADPTSGSIDAAALATTTVPRAADSRYREYLNCSAP